MDVWMLAPGEIRFSQTNQALPPPELERTWPTQWHLTASTVGKAAATQFLTVLWPWKRRAPADGAVRGLDHPGVSACEVICNGRRTVVAFRTADQARGVVKLGDVETDAASVAIGYDAAGTAVDYVVEGARTLRIGATTVLEANSPLTQTGAVPD
jgi:hypothetical protein